MEWGFSHGRFAEICEHLVYLGGDAERLAPVSASRLIYRVSCPACRNGRFRLPRWSTLAGGSCSVGRQHPRQVLVLCTLGTCLVRGRAFLLIPRLRTYLPS